TTEGASEWTFRISFAKISRSTSSISPLSSRGLGHGLFKSATRVRIPLGGPISFAIPSGYGEHLRTSLRRRFLSTFAAVSPRGRHIPDARRQGHFRSAWLRFLNALAAKPGILRQQRHTRRRTRATSAAPPDLKSGDRGRNP